MSLIRTLHGKNGDLHLAGEPPRRGGQAEVYRARDARGQVVAVKVALQEEEARRGVLAEAKALREIRERQPGCGRWLVALLDEGVTSDGRPFLVLPWVEHTLQGWLRARQPSLRRRLEALVLAAEAVVQLHRSAASLAGVVLHRDLKPGNLLVLDDDQGLRVLLADLGGAKERPLHGSTRNTGIHTPWFAPLEQALPLERPPDPSVDVHALAVVIYMVLVGRAPQAVMSRSGLLTQAAEELLALHEAGGGQTSEDRARYRALRRAPLEKLIELDHASALPDEDSNRLCQALAQQLGEPEGQAEERAMVLAEILLPPLRHALDPNPRQRLSRPENLLGALVEALGLLPAPPVPVEAVEVRTQAGPPPAVAVRESAGVQRLGIAKAQRSRLVFAGLAVVIALLATCTGIVAVGTVSGRALLGAGDAPVAAPETAVPKVLPADAATATSAPGDRPERDAVVVEAAQPPPKVAQPVTKPTASASLTAVAPTIASTTEEPALLSSAPPATPEHDSPATPPWLVISLDPRRGSSPYVWVDGVQVARGAVFQGAMSEEQWRVELRESAEGSGRVFILRREAVDADQWRVEIEDPSGTGSARVVRAQLNENPPKVVVQWCQDGAIRFNCGASSDP